MAAKYTGLEYALDSAAVALKALTMPCIETPGSLWVFENLRRSVTDLLEALNLFVRSQNTSLRSLGAVYRRMQGKAVLESSLAMTTIAQSLHALTESGRLFAVQQDFARGVVTGLLNVCRNQSAFEGAVPLLESALHVQPPTVGVDPGCVQVRDAHLSDICGGSSAGSLVLTSSDIRSSSGSLHVDEQDARNVHALEDSLPVVRLVRGLAYRSSGRSRCRYPL